MKGKRILIVLAVLTIVTGSFAACSSYNEKEVAKECLH